MGTVAVIKLLLIVTISFIKYVYILCLLFYFLRGVTIVLLCMMFLGGAFVAVLVRSFTVVQSLLTLLTSGLILVPLVLIVVNISSVSESVDFAILCSFVLC